MRVIVARSNFFYTIEV